MHTSVIEYGVNWVLSPAQKKKANLFVQKSSVIANAFALLLCLSNLAFQLPDPQKEKSSLSPLFQQKNLSASVAPQRLQCDLTQHFNLN